MKAPAFPNEDSFFCRFFTEVSSLRDSAFRPLHEVDFRESDLQQNYKKCPFQDSRRGYLINQAALEQITSEWREVLGGIAFYTALFPVGSSPDHPLARCWRISLASMFAPLYLLHRRENPFPNGAIPTSVSAVFKILLDVSTTLDLMMLQGLGNGTSLALQIQEYANNTGILLNSEFACAGSPKLLRVVLELLTENVASEESGEFADYFPKRSEFLKFSYLMSHQYVISQLYQLSYMGVFEILSERAHDLPNSGEKLSAYERRRRIALSVMLNDSRRKPAFAAVCALVDQSLPWGFVETASESPRSLVGEAEELFCLAEEEKRELALRRFSEFESKVIETISDLQRQIRLLLSSETIFSEPPCFGRSGRYPSETMLHHIQKNFGAGEFYDRKNT